MKKIFALLTAALLLVSCLTGCAPKGVSMADIEKAGELVIATSPDFPPFESLDEKGNVVGIEIEILNHICDKLGVELKIEQMAFDSVLPGVQAGKYDVGVSGISVTPDREKNVLFTTPYCLAAQAIVVVEGSAITDKAGLKDKKIAVQTATTAEEFCMGEGYNVQAFEANADAQTALTTGKVDAWVIDDLTAKDMVDTYNATNPDAKLVILDEAMTSEPYAFAMTKGSDEVIEAMNAVIDELIADGTVAKLFEKYNAPYTSPKK